MIPAHHGNCDRHQPGTAIGIALTDEAIARYIADQNIDWDEDFRVDGRLQAVACHFYIAPLKNRFVSGLGLL